MQKVEYKRIYPPSGIENICVLEDRVYEHKIIDAFQPRGFFIFDNEIKTMKNILEVA